MHFPNNMQRNEGRLKTFAQHRITRERKSRAEKKSPQCYFSSCCERELVFSKNVLCEEGLWAALY